MNIAAFILSHFFGEPISELKEFPYFAPFMAVLEGFFGMMLGFAERMLRIAYGFTHNF